MAVNTARRLWYLLGTGTMGMGKNTLPQRTAMVSTKGTIYQYVLSTNNVTISTDAIKSSTASIGSRIESQSGHVS